MFYQMRDRVRRYRFASACKGVLQTAPVTLDASSGLVCVEPATAQGRAAVSAGNEIVCASGETPRDIRA